MDQTNAAASPIVELSPPTKPSNDKRRPGHPALVPMHKATVARIAASFPELGSSALEACELFYLKGQGSMSSLTGCPACKARSMTEYGCLDCGAEIGGRKP